MNIKSFSFSTVIILFLSASIMLSCGSTKNTVVKRKPPTTTVKRTENLRALDSNYSGKLTDYQVEIIKDAEKYLGAPYRYAGTTSSGFDCSGFTGKVFLENDLTLPRRSTDQANIGTEIKIKDAKPGDLIFFATGGRNRVSHVGIIHDIGRDGEVKFIHASTSKGVMISSLNEKYWNQAFLFVRRVF